MIKIDIPSPLRDEQRFPKEKWKTFVCKYFIFTRELSKLSTYDFVEIFIAFGVFLEVPILKNDMSIDTVEVTGLGFILLPSRVACPVILKKPS